MADSSKRASAPHGPVLLPQGSHAGKPALPLGHHEFTLIGSRNRAHLHLLSSTISRNHAGIINTRTGMYIRDLASRTGVVVNGKRVREADIGDGDVIVVGSFTFKFQEPISVVTQVTTQMAPDAMLEMDGQTLTPLDSRSILIGRRPNCDIPLDSPAVSNTHAIIFESDGRRFVRDLGSRTGTQVNGTTVHQQALAIGDQITIGSTRFRYIAAPASVTQPERAVGGVREEDALQAEPLEAMEAAQVGTEAAADLAAVPFDFDDPSADALNANDESLPMPGSEDAIPVDEPAERAEVASTAEPEVEPATGGTFTAPIDATEAGDDLGLDFWKPEPESNITGDVPIPVEAEAELATEPAQPANDSSEHEAAAPIAERTPDTDEELNSAMARFGEPEALDEAGWLKDLGLAESDFSPPAGQHHEAEPTAASEPSPVPFQAEPLPLEQDTPSVREEAPMEIESAETEPAEPSEVPPAPLASYALEPVYAEPELPRLQAQPAEAEAEALTHSVTDSVIDDEPIVPMRPLEDVPAAESEPRYVESAVEPAHEPAPTAQDLEPIEVTTTPESAEVEPPVVSSSEEAASEAVEAPEQVATFSAETLPEDTVITPLLPVEAPGPEQERAAPVRVEDVDLSAVKFQAEPPPPETPAELVEMPGETIPSPAPLLDLVPPVVVETAIPLAVTVTAEAAAAAAAEALVGKGRKKQPKAPRKKREPVRRASKAKSTASAEPVPAQAAQPSAPVQVQPVQNEIAPPVPVAATVVSSTPIAAPTEAVAADSIIEEPTVSGPEIPSAGESAPRSLTSPVDLPPASIDSFTAAETSQVETPENLAPRLAESPVDAPVEFEVPLIHSEVPAAEPEPADAAWDAVEAELGPIHFETDETEAGITPPPENVPAETPASAEFSISPGSSEIAVTAPAIETIEHTEPTPESALPLDPVETGVELPQPVEIEGALTDTAFGRAVNEFTGSGLGPLIEDQSASPTTSHAPAQQTPSPAHAASMEVALTPREPAHGAPAPVEADDSGASEVGSESDWSFDLPAAEGEDEHSLTSHSLSLEPPVEADVAEAEETSLEAQFEAPLEFDEEPGSLDFNAAVDPLQTEFPLDELQLETEPPLPAAEEEEPDPTNRGHNPYFGMQRDMGSFIGGLPLTFTSPIVEAPGLSAPEPEPVPTRRQQQEEPPELFDKTAEKLDALPDELEAIPDESGALAGVGSGPVAEAPAPVAAPTLQSLAAAPSAPSAPRPAVASAPVAVPAFAGARPSARAGVNAFTGMAIPKIRATDVFSKTAFPPLEESVFRPQPIDIPPASPRVDHPATAAAPAPGRNAQKQNWRSPAGGEKSTAAAPAQPQPPAGKPAALDAKTPRRPWWKNILFLLPLLIGLMIASVAVIIRFFPPHTVVQAPLRLKGLDNKELGWAARKGQVVNVRESLLKPEFKDIVVENLRGQGIAPGFLQDPAAMKQLADPQNSPFDEKRQAVLLTRPTTDPKEDQVRLQTVLKVAYSANQTAAEGAPEAYAQAKARNEKLDSLQRQSQAQQAKLKKLKDDLKVAAGADAQDLLRDPEVAIDALKARDAQLLAALNQANADVKAGHEALDKSQAAAQQPAGADPKLAQMKQVLASLNARLAVLSGARGGQVDRGKALDDALQAFDQQLAASDSKNSTLAGYVERARQADAQVRQLIDSQRQDAGRVAQLRAQLAEHREARLRQVWAGDETLKSMLEERDAHAHRYSAAADSGYTEDATKIRGVLDDLDQKIDARRQSLATGGRYADDLQQNLERTIGRLEDARKEKQEQIARQLALMLALPPAGALPADAQAVVASLGEQAAAVNAAHEQYAGDAAQLSAGEAEAQIRKLQTDVAEQQARLDAYQQRQGSAASVASARQALDAAQEVEAKAQAAYSANLNQLSALRELKDAQARTGELSKSIHDAQEQADRAVADASQIPVLLPPEEGSVQTVTESDQRVWYLAGAMGILVLLFAGPILIALKGSHAPPAPFAGVVSEQFEVPTPRPHEDFSGMQLLEDEEHPAVA